MTAVTIRQSGGANIISLPKTIVTALGLQVGSRLELSIEGNRIVLAPALYHPTLEALLAGSPISCFAVNEEDREWIDAKPTGREG